MKTGIVQAASLLAALGLSSCGTDDPVAAETVTVAIEVSDWNGWDEDHESTETTEQHIVGDGETLTFERSFFETVTATVTFEDNGSYSLTYNQELAPRGEGSGWLYNDTVTEVTVADGESVELASPSYDTGMTYTITVAN